jgi:large subunit ribosomal protein L24e
VAGASVELINKRRTEKPEVRQASREAAIREVKVGTRPFARTWLSSGLSLAARTA